MTCRLRVCDAASVTLVPRAAKGGAAGLAAAVSGDTWTDASDNVDANNKSAHHYRVVYHFVSSSRLQVKFEVSDDATHWNTLGQGEGVKQP